MNVLFPRQNEVFNPLVPDGELCYYPNFFNLEVADKLFVHFKNNTPWQQDQIRVYGKTYDQPRLTALYGLEQKPYTYSNLTMRPHLMDQTLKKIMKKIELKDPHSFNTVLLNFYRTGTDSNGWHADNEKELGENPVIASLTLGEERFFHLKHRKKKDQRFKLKLAHGSLLLMAGAMQHHWLHQIPKTSKPIGERINLTFRKLI